MCSRSIRFFAWVFVVLVVITSYSEAATITGSDPEVAVYRLRTETPEFSATESVQEVKQITGDDLGALLDAGDGAMVTLVTGDTRLVVHRAVLSARSPVLASMFRNDTNGSEVAVPDVATPVLRQLAAYLYTLRAPQLHSTATQLLAAADRLGLSVLKAECEQRAAAMLSVETAAATAVVAVRHSSGGLRQAAVAFIKTHLVQVMSTRGWADAVLNHPKELFEIIRLLSEQPAETSSPAAAAAAAAAPPHTRGGGPTPQGAAAASSPPPDDAAVAHLRNLSAEEKGQRLIQAARQGAVGELQALLAAGADVAAREQTLGRAAALHCAAAGGHVEAARLLLRAGAEVDARDVWQETPLHRAAQFGNAAVVGVLAAAGADPDARNQWGQTPLHLAVVMESAEGVAALLGAGADREVKSSDGKTPLDVARDNGHQQLIDMLTRS